MKTAKKSSFSARAVVPTVALMALACDEPLSQVELIDKTRVVGARVEVAGDASRAAPLPGESVTVRAWVVAPEPEPAFAYDLLGCVAVESSSTVPTCDGPALATATSVAPVLGEPSIGFDAPATATGDERLAVLGLVCPADVALSGQGDGHCADGREALAFTLDFMMDDGSHPNTNPAFTSFELDGGELAPETADTTDCALLPQVARGAKHTLRLDLDPESRDLLPEENAVGHGRESLLISYFVTSGELDHAWSLIDSEAPSTTASIAWTSPAATGGALRLARLIAVVRDGRGGADYLERRVCVQP